MNQLTFHELFKRYPLRSEFESLSELGNALAEKGLIYEDSIYSHWQKGTKVPSNRHTLLVLLELFIEREALTSEHQINELLSSAGQGYLTSEEKKDLQLNKFIQIHSKVDGLSLVNGLRGAKKIGNSEIMYFRGKNEVHTIYVEALKANEVFSFANLSEIEVTFPENLMLFYNAFIQNPRLALYELLEDSPQSRKLTAIQSNNKKFFYKFLPTDIKVSSVDTLIYDGKVAVINTNKITGTVIQNLAYYNNSVALFKYIWKTLPNIEPAKEDYII